MHGPFPLENRFRKSSRRHVDIFSEGEQKVNRSAAQLPHGNDESMRHVSENWKKAKTIQVGHSPELKEFSSHGTVKTDGYRGNCDMPDMRAAAKNGAITGRNPGEVQSMSFGNSPPETGQSQPDTGPGAGSAGAVFPGQFSAHRGNGLLGHA